MKERTTTQKLCLAALLTALCCVATLIIKIPTPMKGYMNLGDCIVLLSGWILGPGYGFLAAGIGSAMADLFSGYPVYAPATFVIKGLMAVVAFYGAKLIKNKIAGGFVGGLLAEILMVLGYFVFEGLLYGFAPSLVNIPANALQGLVGLVLACVFLRLFSKSGLISK